MNLNAVVENTVTGLGFELVELERAGRGLLRVFIDRVPGHVYPAAQGAGEFVTVDDCEVVTRQLQYVLEVEGADYERLEVSSPGLDRPLKREADYARFAGQAIELTLKLPFQGRKHWKGRLSAATDGWHLELLPELAAKAKPGAGGKALAKKGKGALGAIVSGSAAPAQAAETAPLALSFTLDEVREARLVPVIDFKGRRGSAAAATPEAIGETKA